MQVILSKPIVGICRDTGSTTTYAKKGDTLDVVLRNKTHFICDSPTYPDTAFVVFPSQCKEILITKREEDRWEPEKYYNVYEEPNYLLNNDLSDSNEEEY